VLFPAILNLIQDGEANVRTAKAEVDLIRMEELVIKNGEKRLRVEVTWKWVTMTCWTIQQGSEV
jgi:hypothetical protein